jgi:hypothetical protein
MVIGLAVGLSVVFVGIVVLIAVVIYRRRISTKPIEEGEIVVDTSHQDVINQKVEKVEEEAPNKNNMTE